MAQENKKKIIHCFKIMINNVFAENDSAAVFKAREYTDSIKAFSECDGDIVSYEMAESILRKYGKKNPHKILLKIKEILETGTLKAADKAMKNPLVQSIQNLTPIYGIGHKKAIELNTKYGITTIDQLRAKFQQDSSILHNKQKIGLQYFDDLQERIPRQEIVLYEQLLLKYARQISPAIILSINGSYRRKCSTSGDIDVLITCNDGNNPSSWRKELIQLLKTSGIIIETLANGQKKFMGISKLPGNYKYRHIDIIDSTMECYPFGVLYFTGSGGFNAKMRGIALEKGYSLNEYKFTDKKTKKDIPPNVIQDKIGKNVFETEQDIFKFIEMDYVLPENRVNITYTKLMT